MEATGVRGIIDIEAPHPPGGIQMFGVWLNSTWCRWFFERARAESARGPRLNSFPGLFARAMGGRSRILQLRSNNSAN